MASIRRAVGYAGREEVHADVDSPSASVWLHPNRAVGAGYGALAAVLLAVVGLAAVSSVSGGRLVMALVVAVVGLGLSGFLTYLALALLVPCIRADPCGVTGRLASFRRVDGNWDEVRVDAPADAPPGVLRLEVGGDAIELDGRAWADFGDFVLLVASTPRAARRLTPAARSEIGRLVGLVNATAS